MKNSNGNLAMTKGDSEAFNTYMLDDSGAFEPFVTGDTVYFSVKEFPSDSDYIFQKVITSFVDGEALVEIDPADTSGVDLEYADFKRLWYDVQLVRVDGTKKTIVKTKQFILTWEVTTD